MNYNEFAETVKTKYPEYKDVDNRMLAEKVVGKYPEYREVVEFDETPPTEGPGMLKSAALGAMSGIPGAETVVSGIQSLDPNTTYEQAHQGLEDARDKAWDEHPVAYGAGKTAGIVGTGLALPASIPAAIGVGAASGLDTVSKLSEVPGAVTKGAAVGGVLGAAGKYIAEPAINAVAGMLPKAAKSGIAALGKDLNPETIDAYLARPGAINAANTSGEIGEQLAKATGDVTKASGQLSQQARGLLNPEHGVMSVQNGISDVQAVINGAKQQYMRDGVVKTGMEPAINALDGELARITSLAKANNGVVSEDLLRGIIDDLQSATKEASFGNPEVSAKQDALKSLGGRLNDMLREGNAPYAKAMAPSAEAAQLSSGLQKKFSLKDGDVTDATSTKLNNVLKEGKTEGYDLLEQLKGLTGQDFIQKLEDAATKGAFDTPGSGSVLKTLAAGLGFGVGKTSGVPFGGIGGAAVGRFAAEGMHGGQIAKSILDAYLAGSEKFANSALKPAMAKFGPVLVNAAKQGGNKLAATHFVLATSNPEYQELANHMQDQSQ